MADMADLFGSDADSEPEHKGLGLSLSLSLRPSFCPGCPARLAPAAGGKEGGSGAEPRAGGRCLQGRFGCSVFWKGWNTCFKSLTFSKFLTAFL